jgi:hypothetical protein
MDKATTEAVANALADAADELERMSDEHPGHQLPESMEASQAQWRQMLGDARFLRRKAVALRRSILDE